MSRLDPDRLFSPEPRERAIARELYEGLARVPILSPHGHCEPVWFAEDPAFPNPAELLIVPDHYIYRMLYSKGVDLDALGIPRADGSRPDTDPREIWQTFADHWHLFLGTPTRLWFDHVLVEVLGIEEPLASENAQAVYDRVDAVLREPGFRPRALYERFNVEALATTDAATDRLPHHRALKDDPWPGRILPTFRPDAVTDPSHPAFEAGIARLAEQAGNDLSSFAAYLDALRERRAFFISLGATATDHGTETPMTLDLDAASVERLYQGALKGLLMADEAAAFQAHMLTEMARMSLDDGLVMQLHAGSMRNHNGALFLSHGFNVGADIPRAANYVDGLKVLLDAVGNDPRMTLIVFCLDETVYARELAPLAGHYPALLLGPPWWFHDSPEGMLRFRRQVTETAGFFNTAGFNDDTRAFLSIPARHDVARRMDCRYLAELVADSRLGMDDARMLAHECAYGLARRAYRL